MRAKHLLALSGAVAVAGLVSLSASPLATAEPLHVTFPGSFTAPPTVAQCEQQVGIPCYGPTQYEQAYDMNPLYAKGLTGAGKTIVVVDSFGSPTIQTDLQTFDQEFGIPDPPSFKIITPDGPIPAFDPNDTADDMSGWAIETSLDVEYAHAMAPGANILLVETPVAETEGVAGIPQIQEAENFVINHHLGDVITQSFAASEPTFPPGAILNLRSAYINAARNNVTVLGSSGDDGPTGADDVAGDALYPFRVNQWPSSDPLVTSVGGTQLTLDQDGNRLAPDQVWNDTFNPTVVGDTPSPAASSGGLSAVFGRPSYQDGVRAIVGSHRGTPDISMSAAVNGAALVQISFLGTSELELVGGTSEASPLFSGIVAVADQANDSDLGPLNEKLYRLGYGPFSGIDDVVGGNTNVQFTNVGTPVGTFSVPGFAASPGYDLATGLGTADGAKLVEQLAHAGIGRGHGF